MKFLGKNLKKWADNTELLPSFVYKSISVLGTSQWPFLKFTSSRINARGVAGTPVPVGGYNFLYLELILKWGLCVYTCLHVRALACVHTRLRAQPKIFWQKKIFDQKNCWPKKIFFDNFFFHQKSPQKLFWPKKFFFNKFYFYTKHFFLPKKQKNIICAETLILPKHQLRRRATFPEGP